MYCASPCCTGVLTVNTLNWCTLRNSAVSEAGVYGIPDPVWGRRAAAAVVPRPGMEIDEEELLAFCRERLARYKVPARVEVRQSLPRNASGKLLRRLL